MLPLFLSPPPHSIRDHTYASPLPISLPHSIRDHTHASPLPISPPHKYPGSHIRFPSQLSGCYGGREGEGGHEERGTVCVIPDTVRGGRKRGSVCTCDSGYCEGGEIGRGEAYV